MRPLLLALLLAASASAQVAERPSKRDRVGMGVAGMAVGIGAVVATYTASYPTSDTASGVAVVALAYPVGVTLGTVGVARLVGLDAPVQVVFVDALFGSAIGALAGGLVGAVVAGVVYLPTAGVDYNVAPFLIGGAAGLGTFFVVSARVASSRVDVAPAALAAPTGERGAGLRLTLSF